jgi:hypothetical protein
MPEEKEVLFNAMKNDLTVEVVREKYGDKIIGKIQSIAKRKNVDDQDDIGFSVLSSRENGYSYMSPWLSQVTSKVVGN